MPDSDLFSGAESLSELDDVNIIRRLGWHAPVRLSSRELRRAVPSARPMEQATYRLGLGKSVVKRHSVLRGQYVHGDLPFLQKIQRLVRNVKALDQIKRAAK